MRANYFLVLLMTMLVSCVELPNLIPNGNGEDSDMEIFELNQLIQIDGAIYINEDLTLDFPLANDGTTCPQVFLTIPNGNVLTQSNLYPILLQEGDLVGGVIEGFWKNKMVIRSNVPFAYSCVYMPTFNFEEDTILGMRLKIDGKFHYGWIVVYSDENAFITIKAVGYNKQPGTNVRIGG